MDKLGIKGTIYDLLGYIAPGLIFIFGVWSIRNYANLNILQIQLSIPSAVMALLFAYFVGQIFASLSSIILENRWSNRFLEWIYKFETNDFDASSQRLFGLSYNKIGDRLASCYCQHKYPEIYETSLVFLSISGFSRNAFIATQVLGVYYLIESGFHIEVLAAQLCIGFVLIHNYRRFKLYHKKQIATSMNIP